MRISANIGFLYAEMPLPERIRAAAADGFDGVECHWPFDVPGQELATVLSDAGLPMLGLNTHPGELKNGDFGLAAIPDRRAEARRAIAQAIDYGTAVGARNLHVMAGKSDRGRSAETTFRDNLRHACDLAATNGMTILIEPLNSKDHPTYHLSTTGHAAEIISDLARPNLKMMFDYYHVQVTEGDAIAGFQAMQDMIGHIQIAAGPDRGEPGADEIDFLRSMVRTCGQGQTIWVGAEYRPRTGCTADGIRWLSELRRELLVGAQIPQTNSTGLIIQPPEQV